MIDTRRTLTNLHNKFPGFTLDTLFEILDCVAEEIFYTYNWQDKWKDHWRYDKNTVLTTNYGNPTCTATTNLEVPQKCD